MSFSAFSSANLCSSALKIRIGGEDASHIDFRGQHLDVFQRDGVSFSDAGAALLNPLPVGFAGQIGLPERPGPTLPWASGVDRAASLLWIKVNAVAVRVLVERNSTSGRSSIHQTDLADRLVEEFRDGLDLVFIDPDVSGGTRAAVTAPSAFKRKAISIPRSILRRVIRQFAFRLAVRNLAHRFCPISKTAAVSSSRSFAVNSFWTAAL